MDLYLSEDGDLKLSPHGDLAMTTRMWRNHAQQAYIRLMTEVGDFLLYPGLGADLHTLYGLPQSKETGNKGKQLIQQALAREGVFSGTPFSVDAVPVSQQTIRFDVYLRSGGRHDLLLSIEQDLGVA